VQYAGLLGGRNALSAFGFTVIMNIAKHRAPKMNVTTLNASFMGGSDAVPAS
jgi:hypothetical protein